jgi:nicotinamidase/pyrazinamidase
MKTALIVTDVQNDFCHGGTLAVHNGDQVVEPINKLIEKATRQGWRVFVTRDWHPRDHISFRRQGGIWPPHCIINSQGGAFHPALNVPADSIIISKGTQPHQEAYSAFEGTNLRSLLALQGIDHVLVAGLTTEYCIKNTTMDALRFGFSVTVVENACRPVNLKPQDGPEAIEAMKEAGALLVPLSKIIGGRPRTTTIEVKQVTPAPKPVAARKNSRIGSLVHMAKMGRLGILEPAAFSA